MFKYLVAFLLFMHGLAHITGLIGTFGSGDQAFPDRPWLLAGGITPRTTVGRAWTLAWGVALLGLVTAGVSLALGQAWWPRVAVGAAAASLLAIVPWLTVVPPGAYAGTLFDVAILAILLSPWADRVAGALH